MKIQQFVTESLGDASFLVVSGGQAAVIDPQRDIRPYMVAANEHRASIRYVFETHVHNDYISGARELAAYGAEIAAPAGAPLQFAHIAVADGDAITLGELNLVAVAAPGHTYEHTAYLARDLNGLVQAAFTGGALLMGAAGRTDLLGPDHASELTRFQWDTAQTLRGLVPASADVFPTHGAGSFCSTTGADLGRSGPMSAELARNPALTAATYEEFREIQLGNPAPIPAYYRHMAPINIRGARVYGSFPRPAVQAPGAFASLPEDVFRVDVRPRQQYAAGYLPGSLSIEESGSMLAYLSWLVPFKAPLALITHDRAQSERITVELFRIGYEDIRAYIAADAMEPPAVLRTAGIEEAAAILRTAAMPVLDVRYAAEHRESPLPGARPLPFDQIQVWAQEIEAGGPALVVCASGERAAPAATFLRRHGIEAIPLIDGGVDDLLGRI